MPASDLVANQLRLLPAHPVVLPLQVTFYLVRPDRVPALLADREPVFDLVVEVSGCHWFSSVMGDDGVGAIKLAGFLFLNHAQTKQLRTDHHHPIKSYPKLPQVPDIWQGRDLTLGCFILIFIASSSSATQRSLVPIRHLF